MVNLRYVYFTTITNSTDNGDIHCEHMGALVNSLIRRRKQRPCICPPGAQHEEGQPRGPLFSEGGAG